MTCIQVNVRPADPAQREDGNNRAATEDDLHRKQQADQYQRREVHSHTHTHPNPNRIAIAVFHFMIYYHFTNHASIRRTMYITLNI